MKWIKSREQYLNEAKIRDVILPRQAKEVAKVWGEKYLDYEEVDATPNIEQGKWKLSEEDKNLALQAFFDCDLMRIFKDLNDLPDKFNEILSKSLNIDALSNEKQKVILKDLNIKSPTIHQMVFIFDSVFRKLAVSETNATEMVQKDETGRPVRDEEGNLVKVQKEAGDPIFTNNLVNINSFLQDYNRCYPDFRVNSNVFDNRDFAQLRNLASIDENREYVLGDFDVFGKDMYLSISHNPKDILNMSISKFYSSCQHLYGGGYRQQVLGNVFDPNSIPAFLVFDTPMFWDNEKISDQLPLSRMVLRNLESFDDDNSEKKILFDRAYPDRMKAVFTDIIQKYSGNKKYEGDYGRYIFTPDVDLEDEINTPYMDVMGSPIRKPYIGKNIKTLYLSRNHDWSKVKISPKAQVKEIVIETTELPEDMLSIKLNPDWIKFKFLKINTFEPFRNIMTTSVAFDKCKIDTQTIKELESNNLKKLQFVSCDIPGELDLSKFKELEELQVIYSCEKLSEVLSFDLSKIKKLVISGDLIKSKEDKQKISDLRRDGKKVEIIGPVI